MKFSNSLLLLIGCTVLISACGVTGKSARSSSKAPKNVSKKGREVLETGVTSWYGPNFHGKLTANGETYDMDGITAAHRTLPFNSEVLVENLDNGKTLVVRINDRGPYAKDRILDLSRGAARQLGVIGPGTANIKLYLVKGDLKNSRITDLKQPNFTVQLGSYNNERDAKRESRKIKGSRVEELLVGDMKLYRIYYGRYKDPGEAEKEKKKLARKGYNGFVKQIEND